jgi:hypothetical protein
MISLSWMSFDIFVISLKMSLRAGTAKVPFLNHPANMIGICSSQGWNRDDAKRWIYEGVESV